MTSSGTIRLGRQGRLVVPARVREELALSEGDELRFESRDGELVLRPRAAAATRLRGRLVAVPAGRSLVDELLAERRAAAQRGE